MVYFLQENQICVWNFYLLFYFRESVRKNSAHLLDLPDLVITVSKNVVIQDFNLHLTRGLALYTKFFAILCWSSHCSVLAENVHSAVSLYTHLLFTVIVFFLTVCLWALCCLLFLRCLLFCKHLQCSASYADSFFCKHLQCSASNADSLLCPPCVYPASILLTFFF